MLETREQKTNWEQIEETQKTKKKPTERRFCLLKRREGEERRKFSILKSKKGKKYLKLYI